MVYVSMISCVARDLFVGEGDGIINAVDFHDFGERFSQRGSVLATYFGGKCCGLCVVQQCLEVICLVAVEQELWGCGTF